MTKQELIGWLKQQIEEAENKKTKSCDRAVIIWYAGALLAFNAALKKARKLDKK